MIDAVLADKKVVTRKEHFCFACGRKIPPHSTMRFQSNIFEGEIGSIYICKTCDEIMRLVDLSEDGNFYEGCVREPMHDGYFDTPEEWLDALIARAKPEEGKV